MIPQVQKFVNPLDCGEPIMAQDGWSVNLLPKYI
jgi:hypothetical protein